jgi:hypothetical protein
MPQRKWLYRWQASSSTLKATAVMAQTLLSCGRHCWQFPRSSFLLLLLFWGSSACFWSVFLWTIFCVGACNRLSLKKGIGFSSVVWICWPVLPESFCSLILAGVCSRSPFLPVGWRPVSVLAGSLAPAAVGAAVDF